MHIDPTVALEDLRAPLRRFWPLSGAKIERLCTQYNPAAGSPVFTVSGRYTSQGWTEWTQGFQYGWAILQYDATGDDRFLELGRAGTVDRMASHVSHVGVHDHGFNNVSTYGNLRRLMLEGRIPRDPWELHFYELALKASGAVQAARWSTTHGGGGYIYSFNGPQSLFSDTIRSLRSLALGHLLGHSLMAEHDTVVPLLQRAIEHARTTAAYNVFYGEGRDVYDVAGRVAHESVFNPTDGRFRTSSTQQGYSPFSTWTRGLAWVMTGYAEQLEFVAALPDTDLEPYGGRAEIASMLLRAARATCDYYLEITPADGVPYWDTAAPGLVHLGDYLDRPADPFNDHEPVDSSSAAIAAQAFLRLGRYLADDDAPAADRYTRVGLALVRRLLEEPYLSTADEHEGLLLHGVYHRPRGWDHTPNDNGIAVGEAVMWGDYHLVEAALMVQRMLDDAPYYTFFGPDPDQP